MQARSTKDVKSRGTKLLGSLLVPTPHIQGKRMRYATGRCWVEETLPSFARWSCGGRHRVHTVGCGVDQRLGRCRKNAGTHFRRQRHWKVRRRGWSPGFVRRTRCANSLASGCCICRSVPHRESLKSGSSSQALTHNPQWDGNC